MSEWRALPGAGSYPRGRPARRTWYLHSPDGRVMLQTRADVEGGSEDVKRILEIADLLNKSDVIDLLVLMNSPEEFIWEEPDPALSPALATVRTLLKKYAPERMCRHGWSGIHDLDAKEEEDGWVCRGPKKDGDQGATDQGRGRP